MSPASPRGKNPLLQLMFKEKTKVFILSVGGKPVRDFVLFALKEESLGTEIFCE